MRTQICGALTTHRRLDSTMCLVQQTRESCRAAAQLPHLHTATARASLPTAGGRRPRACTWRDARGTRRGPTAPALGTRAGSSAAARARDCDVEGAEIERQSCGSERRSLHGGGLRRSSRRRPRAAPDHLAWGGVGDCRRNTPLEPLQALSTGQPRQLVTCISGDERGAPNPPSS